jgi:hypothetical protein
MSEPTLFPVLIINVYLLSFLCICRTSKMEHVCDLDILFSMNVAWQVTVAMDTDDVKNTHCYCEK